MASETSMAESSMETLEESQQTVLETARQLDRFGRRVEQFLTHQLQQLEQAIDEFEQEKLAWRRQQQREQSQLAKLRQELARERRVPDRDGVPLRSQSREFIDTPKDFSHQRPMSSGLDSPELLARRSDINPIRILLHPGSANGTQIGAWLFEFSKLDREIGGGGTRFEIVESRLPPKRLFGRRDAGVVVELDAFSCLPLTEADTEGEFEVDKSEYLECWIAFKALLLSSSLMNVELDECFKDSRIAPRHHESRSLLLDAIAQANHASLTGVDENQHLRTAFRVSRGVDTVRKQLERLENCTDTLFSQYGFRIHVSLR